MRYRISKNISFQPLQGHLKVNLPQASSNNHVLLNDKGNHREFIINNTIKVFIEKFDTPKTLSEITDEIANEVEAANDVVGKVIDPFLKYIKYRKFIVPENSCEDKSIRQLFNANRILDNYKIVKNIDVNKNIDIYRAIDLTSKNEVVIKLIKNAKKRSIDQLHREFNFLSSLNKTSVTPKAYEIIPREKYAYFVQDYVNGLRLSLYIGSKKRFTLNNILNIDRQIITGFKKIHLKGIIHGDIHPSNIIITKENKVKIIDFGLAINHEFEKNEVVDFGGVYHFMPPERINTTTYKKFKRKPDFSSDVYQIGMIIYTLLYDKYPFNGITWEELATEIKHKAIEFPAKSKYNFSVPTWLKDIIEKCVAKKPTERFANAGEIYNAFVKNKMNNARKIRSTVKI